MMKACPSSVERLVVDAGGAEIEVFLGDIPKGTRAVCAAHPAAGFGAETVSLLAAMAQMGAVAVNPRGIGGSTGTPSISFDQMVDDVEAVRRRLELGPWVFWGMSGGGWLAQTYAHRYPGALAAIVVESACLCFRERLADPACALSPFFPAWRDALSQRGLLSPGSHAAPSSGFDTEWIDVPGLGKVFRRRNGPALLVSPTPVPADMQRAMPALWSFDSRAWIGDVRVPALVIAGTADPVVPVPRVRAVHEAIAGSVMLLVEGGGHVPTSQRRPEIAGALERLLRG